ncbi:adenosylmethionine--8-amino-7-oxononanoate transaminase [Desulfovibrio sp.]|uniref:adenosylmethionine--8-amino-7-oxononanoate transaminase n=1 Tax=Desulfovibrio sp. TaxID=885 RepID=UPI0025BC1B33|nr:adenosylmethionine--8-amino-7-oxononanoate transaminase [Desulfovibrio sp.]
MTDAASGRGVSRRPLCAVFVSGSGTDVGKTVVTAALLRALRLAGVAAQAVKPVQTGVRAGDEYAAPQADAPVYAAAVSDLTPLPELAPAAVLRCFSLPASPHLAAAREGERLEAAELARTILKHWESLDGAADILLLEGAGGLCVPLNEREDMLDLMAALDLPVLLVGGNGLGTLNHTLLSLAALRDRGLPLCALALIPTRSAAEGAPNDEEACILADNPQILRARLAQAGCGAPVLELPRLERLDGVSWQILSAGLVPLVEELRRLEEQARGPRVPDLVERDHGAVWHPYASAVRLPPLCAVRRSHDNRIVLTDGRELIDGMSSWWAAAHGYNHPRLVSALRLQAGRMPHLMFGGLTHAPAVALAERLLCRMPYGLERVFFADSGSVAVEVALKMALQYQQGRGGTRRTRFLTPRGGYHGDTLGAMSVCDPVTGMHSLFAGLLPRQIFMERPSCRFDAPFDPACLDDARCQLERHGKEIAAVILEPVVQGAGGMWFYHPDYLRGLADLCRKAGALLIFDEIATGFGRTGRFFAAEWAGITPDILCCGKALTGGMLTLAATACTGEVAQGICREGRVFMHGPTFMANALACAVAGAALDILDENRWQAQVAGLETAMRQGLEPCRHLPGVEDVRVLGGIGVVETERPVNTAALQACFVEQGVWIRPFNRLIYLMPPYVSPTEDVIRLCAAVETALRRGAHCA